MASNFGSYFGAALASGGLSGLGSYFGGKAQQSATERAIAERARSNERARGYIQNYTYNPYEYSLTPQMTNVVSQYLTGQLSPYQQQLLNKQQISGMDQINQTAAARGIPTGGHLALSKQLAEGLGTSALGQSSANQQLGIQYGSQQQQLGLQEWMNRQNANQQKIQLMAQYS